VVLIKQVIGPELEKASGLKRGSG